MPATTTPGSLIRELAGEEFAGRYGCDRFTATVLSNRFRYIVEHVCGRLLTAAFSPILRDFYDFAATLTGPPALDYPTPAMNNSILLFTGTMTDSVRNTIEEYGPERLSPGDVIIGNDPYRTGTHVNDVLFCRPVFSGAQLAGFVNLKAHQLDMGGMIPGGFSLMKHNVFETGLVISPRALYQGDEPVRETWSLIFDNVRFGEILFPDMQTICAGLRLGERLLTETIDRYGFDAIRGAMRYVCDAAAERMSLGLAAIPDGEWEGEDIADCDGVDDTEEYRVHVKVRKRGARAEVDFSGTSRQARTCINATALDVKSTVGAAFKYLFDPRAPFTSGTWRHIDIVLPEGTVVSALPPDGAVFLYYEMSQVMISALLRALAQAVGESAIAGDRGTTDIHNANGVRPNGMPWVSAAQVGGETGPFGATARGDADTFMLSYTANGIAGAVEAIESDVPVVLMREEPVPDTAGPGFNRGGCAVMRESLWLEAADHNLMSLHYKRPSGFGVNGGGDGRNGGVWIWELAEDGAAARRGTGDDAYRTAVPLAGRLDAETNAPDPDGVWYFPYRQPSWHTEPQTVMRYINRGGGGWGDPFTREPERVLIDVRDGYVTIEGAARDYGVVVVGDPDEDPEGLRLDDAGTMRLRQDPPGRPPSNTSPATDSPAPPQRPPEATRVLEKILGFLETQALHVAAELGVADQLIDGPRHVDELAATTGAHGPTLYRFLRTLSSDGIFAEVEPRVFGLNEAAESLRSDASGSLRDLAIHYGTSQYRAADQAMHSVRTGECGFERAFGMTLWEYHAQHLDVAETFDRAMQGTANGRALAVRAYPWRGDEKVIDLGGGNGAMLIDLLQHHRGLSGVVADLPHVVASAQERLAEVGLDRRCSAHTADLLQEVPHGGDIYMLVIVLHDWGDEDAICILRNCRRAMTHDAKLLIVEMVLPDGDEPDIGKLIDLAMLLVAGGRERTESEWRTLLDAGGFDLTRILRGQPWSILEAVPKGGAPGTFVG